MEKYRRWGVAWKKQELQSQIRQEGCKMQVKVFWLPEGKGGGKERQGVWDERVHSVVFKTDNHEDLLYGTGNSDQYSVTT